MKPEPKTTPRKAADATKPTAFDLVTSKDQLRSGKVLAAGTSIASITIEPGHNLNQITDGLRRGTLIANPRELSRKGAP